MCMEMEFMLTMEMPLLKDDKRENSFSKFTTKHNDEKKKQKILGVEQ